MNDLFNEDNNRKGPVVHTSGFIIKPRDKNLVISEDMDEVKKLREAQNKIKENKKGILQRIITAVQNLTKFREE